ncbi:MAG: hypothetical protein C7B47_14860 [Sulfobacillus thermosulfidooxidans]|uniref:Uncharacterized protein n=1 Tax=Sulfobacillus thermosulfidooxidans TaxID=28034 RepID=A0A2T2WQC2_SULTH|nr:MAG: hypothetical protein C7B47_14860 [Sulfobacillus thermosulfidooxidans]
MIPVNISLSWTAQILSLFRPRLIVRAIEGTGAAPGFTFDFLDWSVCLKVINLSKGNAVIRNISAQYIHGQAGAIQMRARQFVYYGNTVMDAMERQETVPLPILIPPNSESLYVVNFSSINKIRSDSWDWSQTKTVHVFVDDGRWFKNIPVDGLGERK